MSDKCRELRQGYLRIAQQLTEEESKAIEQIQIILRENSVGPLAKQRLAQQLIQEVESFLEVDLTR